MRVLQPILRIRDRSFPFEYSLLLTIVFYPSSLSHEFLYNVLKPIVFVYTNCKYYCKDHFQQLLCFYKEVTCS